MSWMSSISKPSTMSLEPKWQTGMRKTLLDTAMPSALERVKSAGKAYTGELVAPMTGQEQTGQGILSQYLASSGAADSDLGKASQGVLMDTLTGKDMDPIGSTYYRGFKNAVMRELKDAQDAMAAQRSARDVLGGGGTNRAAERLSEGATNTLTTELGKLENAALDRRLSAVAPAMSLAQLPGQEALQKVAASTQYGGLAREIQQAQDDASYQEWLRQLSDLGLNLDVATGLLTYQPSMAIGPSMSSQIAEGVNSAANLIGSIKGMGGGGGTSAGPVSSSK